jgi:hypothetical protein
MTEKGPLLGLISLVAITAMVKFTWGINALREAAATYQAVPILCQAKPENGSAVCRRRVVESPPANSGSSGSEGKSVAIRIPI